MSQDLLNDLGKDLLGIADTEIEVDCLDNVTLKSNDNL